jgi:hypothetical protein
MGRDEVGGGMFENTQQVVAFEQHMLLGDRDLPSILPCAMI